MHQIYKSRLNSFKFLQEKNHALPATQGHKNSTKRNSELSDTNSQVGERTKTNTVEKKDDEQSIRLQNISSEDVKYFQEFPEALHKADAQQCIKFNEQLMRKLVVEKRKKNEAFAQSKLMSECFKYTLPNN